MDRSWLVSLVLLLNLALSPPLASNVAAQSKPEGELRVAMYVTVSPLWFDPGEVTGFITPFWLMWAMHDALVKAMPAQAMAPSVTESWTVSADQKSYDLKLRPGVKFHNGDPLTADDVEFSFERAKGYRILSATSRSPASRAFVST
jgi:peptide/nickel transport system substrate-binding protein